MNLQSAMNVNTFIVNENISSLKKLNGSNCNTLKIWQKAAMTNKGQSSLCETQHIE